MNYTKTVSAILLFALLYSCSDSETLVKSKNTKKATQSVKREFNEMNFIYHFVKVESKKPDIGPAAFNTKVFNISGTMRAEVYPGDTLIRMSYWSKNKKTPSDTSVEYMRLMKLDEQEQARFPQELLGCRYLGSYSSLNEDAIENSYNVFYVNDRDDLLKVVHLYKPGNVFAAFFFSKDSIDPTIKYKNDVSKLLALQRPLSMTDTITFSMKDTFHIKH